MLFQGSRYIDVFRRARFRRHHLYFSIDDLRSELKAIHGGSRLPQRINLTTHAEIKCPTRADGRAHWFLAGRSAVVAHVALHHELKLGLHFRHTEGTGEHAVVAGNTARFTSRLHDAIGRTLDGISRADFGACGTVTMHANDWHSLRCQSAIDVLQVNHRVTAMRI